MGKQKRDTGDVGGELAVLGSGDLGVGMLKEVVIRAGVFESSPMNISFEVCVSVSGRESVVMKRSVGLHIFRGYIEGIWGELLVELKKVVG